MEKNYVSHSVVSYFKKRVDALQNHSFQIPIPCFLCGVCGADAYGSKDNFISKHLSIGGKGDSWPVGLASLEESGLTIHQN